TWKGRNDSWRSVRRIQLDCGAARRRTGAPVVLATGDEDRCALIAGPGTRGALDPPRHCCRRMVPARDLWDSYQTRRQRHSRSLRGCWVNRLLCLLGYIWGLNRGGVLPVLAGWVVATAARAPAMGAGVGLALSSALRNLIPLLTNTIWRAIQYWPTHPF